MAFDLVAKLSLKDVNFTSGIKRASRQMNSFKSMSTELTRSLGLITGAAGAVGVAMSSTKKAMDFQEQMSSVKALTGMSNKQLSQMSQLALKAGADTQYGATDAAKAIEELSKAGMSTSTIMKGGLTASLNLATAGGMNLADSANLLSNALNGFKADGLTASKTADILAGAANASSADMIDLKYGLAAVGSVSSGLGMSLKDTSAALALLSNNSLQGSDAGTSFKTMLSNLSPKTDKAAAEMEKLGIITKNGTNTFFDAHHNIKSMADISGILQNSLKNLNTEQRQQALYTMFGSDAIRAANIFYKEGANGVTDMYKAMGKVTAVEVARQKMNNAKGAVEQFKGAIETLQISALTPLLPVIKDTANGLANWVSSLKPAQIAQFGQTVKTAFVDSMNAVKNVYNFVANNWGLISSIIMGVAVATLTFKSAMAGLMIIQSITKLVTGLRVAYGLMTGAQWALNAAMDANPIGAVIMALSALVAVGVILYKNWDTIKAKAAQLWGAISSHVVSAVHSMVNGVVSVYHSIIGAIVTATNVVKTVAIAGWHALVSGILAVVRPVVSAVLSVFNLMKPGIMQIFNGIKAIAGGIWTAIKNVVLGPVILLYDLVTGNFRQLKTDAAAIFNNLRGAAGQIWHGIKSVVVGYVSTLKGEAIGIFRLLWSSTLAIMRGIGSVVRSIWNGIMSFFTVTIPKIGSSIKNGFVTAVKNVGNAMKSMKTAVVKKFSEIVDSAKALPGKIGNGIVNKAKDAVHGIEELAKKLVSKFRKILGIHSPSRVFTEMGGHIVQGLINGLSAGNLKQFGESVLKDFGGGAIKGWNSVKGFFSGLLGGGSGKGGDVTGWLTAALGLTGTSTSWLSGLQKLVGAESGGNPSAVNSATVMGQHATGLLQMLPSTFAANMLKGHGNILNPVDNAAAAIN
ncbi:phage tail tape measure protein, partial [Heyndrickxia ginsengihumi]|uniref:phage tail tape measure protein n=1 Tax=Heyndrickxia ginsengihumi TaxID=363870 RepID=UPI003D1FB1AA